MLCGNLNSGALKQASASDPFIDDHCKAILIALGYGLPLYLLWCHIGKCASHLLVGTRRE